MRNIFRSYSCSLMVLSFLAALGQGCEAQGQVATTTPPKSPTQLCANGVCGSSTNPNPRFVVAWKFVPMNYSPSEDVVQMRVNDIRSATEMGLDGFGLEAYNYQHALNLLKNWFTVADQMGINNFRFYLIFDMGENKFTAENVVDILTKFGNDPHYFKIGGKPLFSTYNDYASKLGNVWWKDKVLDPLAKSGHPTVFIPDFDRSNPNAIAPTYQNWSALVNQYPSVDGLMLFSTSLGVPFYLNDPNGGHQIWSGLETEENEAKALHDNHKLFIAPYQPYYWLNCKGQRPYFENQGGRGMENFWRSAIFKQKPDGVHLVTWDDYSESTFIQPTRIPSTKYPNIETFPHLAYYELEKYYISWYKTGVQPTITKDGLFFFYRTHPNNAVASNDETACPLGPIPPSQKWGLVTDSLYVTTALTAPAQLVVTSGEKTQTFNVPAGIVNTDVPFNPGKQSFAIQRSGKTMTQIDGRNIVAQPQVYNFNVYSGYAIAGGSNSNEWMPSDKWKNGFTADWYSAK